MRIFCLSDIHGDMDALDYALSYIVDELEKPNTMLMFLGDYIHGSDNSKEVLDKIISLQNHYGTEKVVALLGNHEEWVLNGSSTISEQNPSYEDDYTDDDKYIYWLENLPRYYVAGNTIFVHAGIDESLGELWELTDEYTLTNKYPADIGKIDGLDMKVVAGHIYTSEITNNPRYNDVYYDGFNHYFIDGDVISTSVLPVLMVDTDEDKYYRVTPNGMYEVQPYDEEEFLL